MIKSVKSLAKRRDVEPTKKPAKKHESDVVDDIKAFLDRFGARIWYFKSHGGRFQIPGLPDIIGLVDGRLFAIEVKRPYIKGVQAAGVETSIQVRTLTAIVRAGGLAFFAYSVDDVKRYFTAAGLEP